MMTKQRSKKKIPYANVLHFSYKTHNAKIYSLKIIFWLFRVPPIRSPGYLRGADKTRSEITNIPCPTLNSSPSGDDESHCSVLTTSLILVLLLWSEVRTVRHESPSTPSSWAERRLLKWPDTWYFKASPLLGEMKDYQGTF